MAGLLVAASIATAGCARPKPVDRSGLCADVSTTRQLLAGADGLSQVEQIERIQALEGSLTTEAIGAGAEGDGANGTAAAQLAQALGAWKNDIALDQDAGGDRANAAAAVAEIQGCG